MEKRIGNQAVGRSPPRYLPKPLLLPYNGLGHSLQSNNAPEAGTQNPLFIRNQEEQTLSTLFSRLNVSGVGGSGSTMGDTVSSGQGFLPLSLQQIQQTSDEFHSWSLRRNGIGTLGEVGLGNHEARASGGNRDSFLGVSNFTHVIPELNVESELESGAGRYAYWNQSSTQLRRPQPAGALSSNGYRPSSRPLFPSYGETDGLVSENLIPTLYHRGLQSQLQQQLFSLNHLRLEDLRDRIVPLAKNQYGCRFLQEKFSNINSREVEMIFLEIIQHVCDLMLDQFGNYIVQKLVEVCNEEQMTRILLSVTRNQPQLIYICLNMHGTRVMQKLLEHLTTPQQISIAMSALCPVTVALTKDTSGHHVIQHCLKLFSIKDNMYLLKEVADNCFEIATNRSGCCVLQSCVEHSDGEIRELLIAEIVSNALPLAEDRYGNYVVQHLMGLKIPEVTTNLLSQFEGSFISLSCNKYGSNVVEKFLAESKEDQSSRIILELLRDRDAAMLLLDPFGNFVVQSALSVSKGVIHDALVNLVRSHAASMRSNLYGKKVLGWFDKRKLQHVYMQRYEMVA